MGTDNITAQHLLVYRGITAVAARCDGARTEDGVGFNGQDTHFGRRIAAMPFDEWTPEIRAEAARIANTYQAQIAQYTGIDVTELSVVKAAAKAGTSHAARDQARQDEKRRNFVSDRKARLNGNIIELSWSSKDPECFGVLLSEVKQLPGRRWTGSKNEVNLTIEALDFIERHSVEAHFDVDAERAKLLPANRQVVGSGAPLAPTTAEKAPAKPANVTLEPNGRQVRIRFDYNPDMVAAVRTLPGRDYQSDKSNLADLHVDVLLFAERFGLVIDPSVETALKAMAEELAGEIQLAELNEQVSRLAEPAELPEDFVTLLLKSGAKVEVA